MSTAGQIETRLDQRHGGLIAFVTVDNSSRLNVMNSVLMDEFIEKLSELAARAELRALVLTGAGDRAFIGGADIREMSALSDGEDARRFITRLHKCCDAVRSIPVPTIARINAEIAKLADGKTIRFLDVNPKLADAKGTLFEGVMVDGLHLSLKGYEVWAAGLKPILTELLGPPAATDHAPPPTGDPSAKPKGT